MTSEMRHPPAVLDHYAIMHLDDSFQVALRANLGNTTVTSQLLDRVRVPAGGATSWEIPGLSGVDSAPVIEGVILAWRHQRVYWRTPIDESGGGNPPDCASDDAITGVGDPGGSCLACPLAVFGTAVRQGKPARGQACREQRLLFLVRAEDRMPLVVVVPPTSLPAIKRYMLRLIPRPYHSVVSRLSLVSEKSADGFRYSEIAPSMVSELSGEEQRRVVEVAAQMAVLFQAVRAQDEPQEAPEQE